MKHWKAVLAVAATLVLAGPHGHAAEVVVLDGVTLDSMALDNGCSTATLLADEVEECRYRVCFSLLKSLWLLDEANRRNLDPDAETMERLQREFERSAVGENLTFTVMPRLKFQRDAIELYRKSRADNPDYSIDDLWMDVATSATQLEIPERALRALVMTYGTDEKRFVEFQNMFPDDHESALARSRNDWEREARRVALEKQINPDDKLTSGELEMARQEWQQELDTAPEATDAMLRQRKRDYNVNVYLRDQIRDNATFADPEFRDGLLKWIEAKIVAPDSGVFESE